MSPARITFSRRRFLALAAGATASAVVPGSIAARPLHVARRDVELRAAPAAAPVLGPNEPKVAVWAYNGKVPGPEIRVRQGERVRIVVVNDLKQGTSVHWHGVRVPNDQDGVPHLTQKPIEPNQRFAYEFECLDAGTFWYHPHLRSFEQVGRGLYGALIVEEREPIRVDRDLTWVLDDWHVTNAGQLSDTFGHMHDVSHGGQIGNVVTVNGGDPLPLHVRAGERIRLRLINAANARIFALNFRGHDPRVIAYDGQPVKPHAPVDGRVVLGPAMRVDLVLDATGETGKRYTVRDTYDRRRAYELVDIVYDAKPLRRTPLENPIELAPNPLAEPDLSKAEHHEFRFEGGAMGGLTGAKLDGRAVTPREMIRAGKAWAVNGIVATEHAHDPLLTLRRGHSYRFTFINDTVWPHPMHLHGHVFRVLQRNGRPTTYKEWQDTVLMDANETTEIAFVADNPGDWMLHCHILEHQDGGMMAVIRVA